MTWVAIATEDEPSEAAAERIIESLGAQVHIRLRRGGFGYLRSRLPNFSDMAKTTPVFLLTDLDNGICPQALIQDWSGGRALPEGLHFRVVVREIETWFMADRQGFAEFLGIREQYVPDRPEDILDPKAKVLELAARSKGALKKDMLPAAGSVASQELGYSARLASFARQIWSIDRASVRSNSLSRAVARLRSSGLSCNCCD